MAIGHLSGELKQATQTWPKTPSHEHPPDGGPRPSACAPAPVVRAGLQALYSPYRSRGHMTSKLPAGPRLPARALDALIKQTMDAQLANLLTIRAGGGRAAS